MLTDRMMTQENVVSAASLFAEMEPIYQDIIKTKYFKENAHQQGEILLTLRQNTAIESRVVYTGEDRSCQTTKIVSEILVLGPEVDGREYQKVVDSMGGYKSSDPNEDHIIFWHNEHGINANIRGLKTDKKHVTAGRRIMAKNNIKIEFLPSQNRLVDEFIISNITEEFGGFMLCSREKKTSKNIG